MNKTELVEFIAKKCSLSKDKSKEALEAVLAAIRETLCEDGSVTIPGFGTFQVQERKERDGRNPKDGSPLKIPAQKSPSFKPSKKFKEELN